MVKCDYDLDNLPMWVPISGLEGEEGIKSFFTTRHGGVSGFPCDTLNFSFQRKDSKENVMENFRRLSEKTGIPIERMVLSKQVHGSTVCIADSRHCGMGLTREHTIGDTDGLITAVKGIALVTFHADCTPVYLYDKTQGVIGLVHSGWRSTLENITVKAVRKMIKRYNCKAGNIIVAFGPHINECCFEVGAEVHRSFVSTFPYCSDMIKPYNNKWKVDLSGIITKNLFREGLKENNIHDGKRCTMCEKELFFSYRGGKGNTGTAIALLMMTE